LARPRAVGALRRDLRAARMVVRRELLHFLRDRTRSVILLLQPFLFLFVLGVGLSRLIDGVSGTRHGYLVFLFPGVLVMAVQMPAISAGASIVEDRQSGFLREMLVAPVRRGALLVGKCVGGAAVATTQGLVVLACAGLIGVPWRADLAPVLAGELALTALALTSLGALVAAAAPRPEAFSAILSFLMTPLIFLSGLMFPITSMPRWVSALSLGNPLSYAVDAMRHAVVGKLAAGPSGTLFQPLSWGSWQVPPLVELAVVAAFTLAALCLAARCFGRVG
jgi:ABC-2 type transport system permease protein